MGVTSPEDLTASGHVPGTHPTHCTAGSAVIHIPEFSQSVDQRRQMLKDIKGVRNLLRLTVPDPFSLLVFARLILFGS
jgi:hypothetical protein